MTAAATPYVWDAGGIPKRAGRWVDLAGYAPPPKVCTNVSATPGTGEIVLTWDPPTEPTGVTHYNVGRGGTGINGVGPWSTTVDVSVETLTFSNLDDVEYDVWVEPVSSGIVGIRTTVQATPTGAGSGSDIVGDTDNAYVEARLLTDPDVLWIWNQNNPAGAMATLGGSGFDENGGRGGSLAPPTRSFVASPADYGGEDPGDVMRMRFPLSETNVQHTNYVGYGQFSRRRFTDLGLPTDKRHLFFRYAVWFPSDFHPYSGGKLPSFFGQPPEYPLAGASGMSSAAVYNEYSWWAGIMWAGPSAMSGYGGSYSGDSNLDHNRVQCYVYAKQIHGVTFTQAAVDGGRRGWNVKLRSGLDQDPATAETASGTGTGGYLYLNRGAWNTIEQEVVLNDSGSANGELRMWINGVLGLNMKCIKWANDTYNATATIRCLMNDIFFGGPYANASAQEIRVADYVFSEAYIGPRGS